MKNLSLTLRDALIEKGANLVGFADLQEIEESSREYMNFGISVAVAMTPRIVKGISDGPTMDYFDEYNRLNAKLDEIAEFAADLIKSYGFNAIPKSMRNVTFHVNTRSTTLPHKTVATRAGLGWIGKSALLVTKEYGSAIRISSVLTDAQLDVGVPTNESKCGGCMICHNVCPGKAIKGKNWDVAAKTDTLYDASNCSKMARERTKKIGLNLCLCGLCILECPWTKKYLNLES
jgi:epoxyqueuosine reductase QueG